jgi:hypothetical protein
VGHSLPPGSHGFPSRVYPRPVRLRGPGLGSCPSGAGLEPFGKTAIAAAKTSAGRFNAFSTSLYGDPQLFDLSWWSELFSDWVGNGYGGGAVISVQAAG